MCIGCGEWVPERWIGSCRRELFDHVIAFNELHAVRLARA